MVLCLGLVVVGLAGYDGSWCLLVLVRDVCAMLI